MTAPATWLRVVVYETRGIDYDTSLDYMVSSIAYFTAVLEKQPGFVVAYWGEDFEEGRSPRSPTGPAATRSMTPAPS